MGMLDRLTGQLRRTSTTNVLSVRGSMLLTVVGESYRQDTLRAVARVATDATPFLEQLDEDAFEPGRSDDRRWFRAALLREPANPQDPNTVAIHATGVGLVGYLSREDAARYQPVFLSAEERGFGALACPAILTGGEGWRDFGVVLAFSAPGSILRRLSSAE